jgi:hypothetical protein
MGNESYYLVKNDKNVDITADLATLNGCRIGVLDSAMVDVLNKYLDENNVSAEVVTYSDYTELFDAFDTHMSRIESGRVIIEESEVHLPDVISELKTLAYLLWRYGTNCFSNGAIRMSYGVKRYF